MGLLVSWSQETDTNLGYLKQKGNILEEYRDTLGNCGIVAEPGLRREEPQKGWDCGGSWSRSQPPAAQWLDWLPILVLFKPQVRGRLCYAWLRLLFTVGLISSGCVCGGGVALGRGVHTAETGTLPVGTEAISREAGLDWHCMRHPPHNPQNQILFGESLWRGNCLEVVGYRGHKCRLYSRLWAHIPAQPLPGQLLTHSVYLPAPSGVVTVVPITREH